MKKIIVLTLILSLVLCSFSGCTGKNQGTEAKEDGIQVVTTIFPLYDWMNNVLGDNPAGVTVTMLQDSGVDLHNYQPTTDDIMKISKCDLLIYVGGESDEWISDAVEQAENKNMIALNLMDALGDSLAEEELVEGMEAEEEEHGEEPEEKEYDEHIWLSMRLAAASVLKMAQAMEHVDQANQEVYKENAAAYIEKLHMLDVSYRDELANAKYGCLLFGDRFPFRYLTMDYGLDYYAAFSGCSAESEASFETVAFLARKLDELNLPVVLKIDGSDGSIAETVKNQSGSSSRKILTLNSMQSVDGKAVEAGASYMKIMEDNLKVLKEALEA